MARGKLGLWFQRDDHKRRINRNESAGQCDGFLWAVDILTGSIISWDSRFLFSSFFSLSLFLLLLSSSETQQVVLWRGCHTVRAGDWREGTPPASILPCPRPRTNLWTWDPRFYVLHRYTLLPLLFSHLLPLLSLIRPLKKYISRLIILWAKLVSPIYNGVSPVNDL